ncbi:facilitated trehalose transporter Tret1-like [Epargyreus clarus]|uniref:facilitated trehalose transporter Tret1-like n=1 Tax=Epargyreus clarus TaxID=520877 RepID=UPI003C2F28E7
MHVNASLNMEDGELEPKEIFTDFGISIYEHDKNTWKPVLRQCMICIGVWYIYLMQGLYLGVSTVLIAQVRREANSTAAISDEMSSWLSSMPVITALPMILILPWLCYRIGRKYTYFIVCLVSSICYIVFYFSTNLYHVLIGQIFLGASTAAVNTFTPVLISEYTSPKYRGILLTFKSASTFWGIWISNAIGTFFYWKNISIVSFTCSLYVLTILTWPESPTWLAMKGRYTESAKSHRWLKGVNDNSEKELAKLITFHKNTKILQILNKNDMTNIRKSWFHTAWSIITSREFYKPGFMCLVLLAQYHFTGKFVISIYAIEVLKHLTDDEALTYKAMLILDGVTVVSMYLGCILSRYFKRRTLMLLFGSTGILLLYTMSCYVYLVSRSIVQENNVLIVCLLSGFSIATGCGPMIFSSSIYGEIMPSRYQTLIMSATGFGCATVMAVLLKISPFMFKTFKMHGTFLFFAICSTIIVSYLYIYLPETKNKTVREIEEHFCGNKSSEQKRTLLEKR